jgi:DNA-binding transcriptional LysR family regulator
MDIVLLRTFLEVRRTRHFARAADNLFVTQAAVSARVRQLEGLVGQRLFTRARNNIQLTNAGHRLVPHAEAILAGWDRALMEMAVRDPGRPLMTVGCLPSLREIYLDGWLVSHPAEARSWLLQVESVSTAEMVTRAREGAITVGILYEPPRTADLWIEPLTQFDLRLVSTKDGQIPEGGLPGYIYVDWGPSFALAHEAQLSGMAMPDLRVDTPMLAREILLREGGSAYLAEPMIREELAAGRLLAVQGAPVIQRRVYMISGRESQETTSAQDLFAALRKWVQD